jgi:hypothetical protein
VCMCAHHVSRAARLRQLHVMLSCIGDVPVGLHDHCMPATTASRVPAVQPHAILLLRSVSINLSLRSGCWHAATQLVSEGMEMAPHNIGDILCLGCLAHSALY